MCEGDKSSNVDFGIICIMKLRINRAHIN